MALAELFPAIEPNRSGTLKVSPLHTLAWEESGNPKGVPVVNLHGGPGAGTSPFSRRLFNPADWRIVIFDQRGSGRSTPLYETRDNTTEALIEDIETLRRELGIEKWHVFGGSWGSTLALAYAEKYPERCLGIILRGVCLMRKKEVDWFIYGLRTFFPEKWEAFASLIPPDERGDLLEGYSKIFRGEDETLKQEAAERWLQYEVSCATLLPLQNVPLADLARRSALPALETHYFKNNLFTPDDALLHNIDKIRGIPGIIIQGRYDMICPVATAYDLHKAWPEATFRIIPDAGHIIMEPGIRSALIEATEAFKAIC